jgi:hypothetical protein
MLGQWNASYGLVLTLSDLALATTLCHLVTF